jgi:PAS domain S-box-containing protein
MPWRYTPFLPFLFLSSFLAAATAVFTWRHRPKSGATWITVTLVGIGLWGFGQAMSHASVPGSSTAMPLFWYSVSHVGTALTPTAWLLFALHYTGRDGLLTDVRVGALWVIQAVFVFLTVTNRGNFGMFEAGHELVYVDPVVLRTMGQSLFKFGWTLEFTWGVGMLGWVVVAYLLHAVADGLLVRKAVRSRNVYRKRSLLLVGLNLALLVSHAASVFGLSPLPHLLLGPFVFLGVGMVSLLVISSDRFLDVVPAERVFTLLGSRFSNTVPVARNIVIEEMGSGVLVIDEANYVVDINPKARAMLDRDRERIIGQRLDEVVDAGIFQTAETPFLDPDVREGSYEGVWVEANGVSRCYDIVITDLADRAENASGRVAIVHDVTDQKRRERQLQSQTDDLSELTEKVSELHAVASDLQTCKTEAEIFELTIEASEDILDFDWCVVSKATEGWFELTAVSNDAPFEEGTQELQIDEGESGHVYQTGETRVCDDVNDDSVTSPINPDIRSTLTTPIGDIGVLQGISSEVAFFDDSHVELAELLAANVREALQRVEREQQMRQQQAELERQNERLEEFASIVSHDLRSPLNLAQGQLGLAETHGDEQYFRKVEGSLDRMNEIIDEMLTLARQGQTVTDREVFRLEEACETTWEYIESGEATLVTEADRTVEADRARVLHIFENLVRNAMDHGPGDVTITVGDLEDGFYVEDDGPGIPEDEQDSVFEKGYTTDENGTGFGLSIVEAAVEAHGWEIGVTEGPAGGARFEVTGLSGVEKAQAGEGETAES